MHRGLAAAAATAVAVACISCVICAAVAAIVALILATAATAVVILLYKQEYEDENQYPCAGIAAEKTIAAHIVLPPFSDFTIYYAVSNQGVKN